MCDSLAYAFSLKNVPTIFFYPMCCLIPFSNSFVLFILLRFFAMRMSAFFLLCHL